MDQKTIVKTVMAPIEEYNTIDAEAPLCDAIFLLKNNFNKITSGEKGTFHKTLFVTDATGAITGKLSIFDLIRGLVPERAKAPAISRTFYRSLSERQLAVADEVGRLRERFDWLDKTFLDLVREETQKKVKEVMSPIHPLLEEDDTLNKAIYVMFKENIRQPLVVRDGRIVGVINIMDIFPVILETAGDQCFINSRADTAASDR
jgi:CBS domain-containing protein